jgi:FixJ family two-component response regulator
MTSQVLPSSRLQVRVHAAVAPRRESATPYVSNSASASSAAVVHVVSSDPARITRLTQLFSSLAMSVRVFKTAADYIANAVPDRISCVILDLVLPDLDGLEVQNRLAGKDGPPVVFLSAHGDLHSGVRAMKNGAIDFLVEPFDFARLLAAVELAFAQDSKNRQERVERACLLRRWDSLTPREQDVFVFTVAGFLNKQAAAELGITENTFQVHRGRVMRKMKANSLADLVRMSTRLESLSRSPEWAGAANQSLAKLFVAQREGVAEAPSAMLPSCGNGFASAAALYAEA